MSNHYHSMALDNVMTRLEIRTTSVPPALAMRLENNLQTSDNILDKLLQVVNTILLVMNTVFHQIHGLVQDNRF